MFSRNTLLFGVLLISSAAAGAIYVWSSMPNDEQAELQSTDEAEPSSPEIQNVSTRGLSDTDDVDLLQSQEELDEPPFSMEEIHSGDGFLYGGNYAGAYEKYRKVAESSERKDGALLLRMALAAERAELLDEARKHYMELIDLNAATPVQRFHALMGMARVWQKLDNHDDAIAMMSELYLVYAHSGSSEEVRIPIFSQLAQALQQRLIKLDSDSPFQSPLEFSWKEISLETVLAKETNLKLTELPPANSNALKVIQNPVNDLTLILVNATLANYPVLKLINELQTKTGVPFSVSDQARSILTGRSLRISGKAIPVATLMDQATGPLNLMWVQNGENIEVRVADEFTSEGRIAYEIDRLSRLHQQMQFVLKDDDERAAMLMNDANNSFAKGNIAEASTKMNASLELAPVGELAAGLYYNAGHLALAQERREEALDRFYQALDQTLIPRLQSKAYGMISVLELQLGRPDRAIVSAARGLRITDVPEDANRNLLVLAKAYLLDDNPLAASRMLHEYSDVIQDESNRRLASVLSTYARFLITKPTSGLQDEGERLVLALAGIKDTDVSTFIDHLLVSRAFQSAGFGTKSLKHLSIAADSATGWFWPERIRLTLIEMQVDTGDYAVAYKTIMQTPASNESSLETKRQFLYAKVLEELGRPEECIATCRTLLQLTPKDSEKQEALRMLGRSYQKLNQHYAAALCFAGLLPEPTGEPGQLTTP